MSLVGLVLTDIGLLIAAFLSAYAALGWGEMGSYPLHGDKSALGGLVAVMLFMAMRWSLLAVALAVAVTRGGLPMVPGTRWTQLALVLGLHLLVGLASLGGFNWISGALQHDLLAPRKLAWIFAFVVPLPAFGAAFWGLHRHWISRHPILVALIVGVFGWAHAAAWRQGYVRPTPPIEQGRAG